MIDQTSEHFKKFQASLNAPPLAPNSAGGRSWAKFSANLHGVTPRNFTPCVKMGIGRDEVLDLVRSAAPTIDCAAAALAWGNMRMANHQTFFAHAKDGWLEVAEGIRNGNLPRAEAFTAFRMLRAQGKMHGVGVAFYTKLIHFLGCRHSNVTAYQGHIVDQWSGCSMNLLTGSRMIHCNVTMKAGDENQQAKYEFTVSDIVGEEDYEAYCLALEQLASICHLSVDAADHALQRDGSWRKHVKRSRVP